MPSDRFPMRLVAAHRVTLAIQVCAWGAVLLHELHWQDGLLLLGFNLAGLFALVLCPRCRLLGPNLVRLAEGDAASGAVALTFDDGPDPTVTPQVLDILDRYGARASFFCIGERAARHPELIREILHRGHTVENHSQRHAVGFAAFSSRALQADVLAAQQVLQTTGATPRYFRAPMGFRSPLLAEVLRRADLTHVAWTRRGYDRVLRDPLRIYAALTQGLAPGDILLLHDYAGLDSRPATVLEVLPRLLDYLSQQELHAVALPPPHIQHAAEASGTAALRS
ncbi:hypothetical protein BJI67_10325 [Acidihalobacter aeolianus]|uniref:NodB homology domain-containing protein n=1 Tax=Acidihalobacter aeolianus TaxID=2792603 RepID=A0A1D8KC76_9GAMM|nr:hypothetical protein BJI67_10325 [Acidihalobacter aeolianus]